MSRTAATVTNETPSGAAHHLLAYLEEGRVRVYAPRRQSLWIMQQLPQAEELRIETQLRELHRTGRADGRGGGAAPQGRRDVPRKGALRKGLIRTNRKRTNR